MYEWVVNCLKYLESLHFNEFGSNEIYEKYGTTGSVQNYLNQR